MGRCNTAFDLKINSRSSDISSFMFCSENILVLLANLNSGELRCPPTALIMTGSNLFPGASVWVTAHTALSAHVFPSLV